MTRLWVEIAILALMDKHTILTLLFCTAGFFVFFVNNFFLFFFLFVFYFLFLFFLFLHFFDFIIIVAIIITVIIIVIIIIITIIIIIIIIFTIITVIFFWLTVMSQHPVHSTNGISTKLAFWELLTYFIYIRIFYSVSIFLCEKDSWHSLWLLYLFFMHIYIYTLSRSLLSTVCSDI